MIEADLAKFSLPPDATVLEALKKIDASSISMVVICLDDTVMGVLTDGDLRRALINGAALSDSVAPFYSQHFFSVPSDAPRADVLDLMQARSIDQIPIVDAQKRLKGIHTMHSILGGGIKPNWAVIMAGGKGRRLGKLTECTPKPMLKVAGKPILERILLHLIHHGIRRVFLSINYLGDVIEDYFGDGSRFGCRIDYLREDKPLGTGGALSLLPEDNAHPVLVLNGDLVTQTNFEEMLAFHTQGGYFATMGLRPYAMEIAFGCAETEGELLTGLREKPVVREMVNAGVYVLSRKAIASVPRDTAFPITGVFEEAFAYGRACGAYSIQEDWLDVGRPRELSLARGGDANAD